MKSEIAKYDQLEAIKNEDFTKEQDYMKEKAIEKARTAYMLGLDMYRMSDMVQFFINILKEKKN